MKASGEHGGEGAQDTHQEFLYKGSRGGTAPQEQEARTDTDGMRERCRDTMVIHGGRERQGLKILTGCEGMPRWDAPRVCWPHTASCGTAFRQDAPDVGAAAALGRMRRGSEASAAPERELWDIMQSGRQDRWTCEIFRARSLEPTELRIILIMIV